jgi:hypothetical protein
MEYNAFLDEIKNKITSGLIFDNPGGGTSIIISITQNNSILYKRGNSNIYISIENIFKVYKKFKNTECTTTKLKSYMPNVFKSKGCNCTFLFLVLNKISLCSEIKGLGQSQSPFYVEIY